MYEILRLVKLELGRGAECIRVCGMTVLFIRKTLHGMRLHPGGSDRHSQTHNDQVTSNHL